MIDSRSPLCLGKEDLPLRPPGVLMTLATVSAEMASIDLAFEAGSIMECEGDGDDQVRPNLNNNHYGVGGVLDHS